MHKGLRYVRANGEVFGKGDYLESAQAFFFPVRKRQSQTTFYQRTIAYIAVWRASLATLALQCPSSMVFHLSSSSIDTESALHAQPSLSHRRSNRTRDLTHRNELKTTWYTIQEP